MTPQEQSQQTKQEATEILEKTGVLTLLNDFGDVRIGGSYYTDLMFGPDIDITVATKTPRESATHFLQEVIATEQFQKYQYGDFESHSREGRPKDHIIVLILPYKDRKWEIEIWFKKEHNQEQIDLEQKLIDLPEEKKKEIIKRKASRENQGQDKHELSSYVIYLDELNK